jgi:hypothetical protein
MAPGADGGGILLACAAALPPSENPMLTTTLFVPLLLAAPQGPQFEAPVRMRAGDSTIKVEAPGFAAPCWQDADGDGNADLVVGQFHDGKIAIYKNVGGGKLAARTWLQAEGANAEVPGVW